MEPLEMGAMMDLQEFWKVKGISEKVAESANYTYFDEGEVDVVVEACSGLGKPDAGVRGWARQFENTNGVVIPTVCLVTGKQKMPQVKPFISVKTGMTKFHFHGSDLDLLKLVPRFVRSTYCVYKKFEGKRKLVFEHSHDQLLPEELEGHVQLHTRTLDLDLAHSHSIACYKPTNQGMVHHINKGKEK